MGEGTTQVAIASLSNDLLLWMVIFAIVAGTVGLAIKVVRKFGIKGRR